MHSLWLSVCRYPGVQEHWSMAPLPATESESSGQAMHTADDTAATDVLYELTRHNAQAAEPAASLYDPAAHAVHVPPSAPV